MATTNANLRQIFVRDIVYLTYRKSVWLNLFNRQWESESEMGWKTQFSKLTDNVTASKMSDRTSLETGPTFSTATVSLQDANPFYLRAHGQINLADTREAGPGPMLESRLAEVISTELALKMDDELASVVTGNTYSTANTNLLSTLGSSTNYIARAFPHKNATSAALPYVANAIAQAELQLRLKNVVNGQHIGPGQPSSLAAVMNPALASLLIDYLEDTGAIDQPGSAGRQAAQQAGILSNSAYMGRYRTVDIVSTNSLAVPTGSANWEFYIIPTNSTCAAGVSVPDIDDARFGEGNTDGAYVWRRTVVQRGWGEVLRPAHLVKAVITGG